MTNTPADKATAAGTRQGPLSRTAWLTRVRVRAARAGTGAALLLLVAATPTQAGTEPSVTSTVAADTTTAAASTPAPAPDPTPPQTAPAPAPENPEPIMVEQPPGVSGYLPAEYVLALFIAALITYLTSRPGGKEAIKTLVTMWRGGGGGTPPLG